MKRLYRNHAIFSWNWNSPSIWSRHVMWSWCRSSKTARTPTAVRHCTSLLHWRHNERDSASTHQRLHKNIERHTAHTIVSWPYPKQWVIVHTSDFMMITRQSVYILCQSSQGKWVNWKHTAAYIELWVTFAQRFVQAQIKENFKALRHWPLCGEFTGYRWIHRTKGQWGGK